MRAIAGVMLLLCLGAVSVAQTSGGGSGNPGTMVIPNRGMQAGTGKWMQIPDNPSIAIPVFTAECWVRSSSGGLIVTRDVASGSPSDWQLWFDISQNRLAFITARTPPDSYFFTPNNSFMPGQWYHVALVVNGPAGRAQVYINGNLVISPTFTPRNFDCSTGLTWCGYYNNASGAYLQGEIDEARYWNVERTQAQIRAARNIDLPSNDRVGLVGWWRFCDSFEDYSGAGNHGTPVGNPQLVLNSLPFGITCDRNPCDTAQVDIAGTTVFCEGDSTTLSATAGFRAYRWSTGDTTRSIVVRSAGRYRVEAVVSDSCTVAAEVEVRIEPRPLIDAGPDRRTCKGIPIWIGGMTHDPALWYRWEPLTGLSHPDSAHTQVLLDSDGTYVLTAWNDAGCSASDTVRIQVLDGLPIALPDSVQVCPGTAVTLPLAVLGGTAPYRFQWTPGDDLSATDVQTPTASPPQPRWYRVTVTDSLGCTATDSILVAMGDGLELQLPDSVHVCAGEAVVLPLDVTGGTGRMTFRWTPPVGLSSTTIQRPTARPAFATTYHVHVTDSLGCEADDSIRVLLYPAADVTISIEGPPTFCVGDSVKLRATPGFVSYRWYTPSRIVPDTGNSLIARETGSYRVSVIDSNGCETLSQPVMITTFFAFDIPVAINGSQPLCEGDTLLLEAGSGYHDYVWKDDSGTVIGTGRELAVGRAVRVRVYARDSLGCTGRSQEIVVTIAAKPVFSISGPLLVCLGSVHDYSTLFRSRWAYQWSVDSGLVRGALNRESVRIEWDTPGRRTLRLHVVDTQTGCADSVAVVVMVITALEPRILVASPTVFCEGDSIVLRSRDVHPRMWWTDGTGTAAGDGRSITVRRSGIYVLHAETDDGCAGADSIAVTALPAPAPRITGPVVVCLGDTAAYRCAGGERGMWDSSGGDRVAGDSSGITQRWTQPGRFRVIVTVWLADSALHCSGTDTLEVEVQNPVPLDLLALPDSVICETDSVQLSTVPGLSRYVWELPGGTVDTTANTLTVRSAGVYRVRGYTSGGCESESLPVTLTVLPAPDARISGPASMCRDGVARYTVPAGSGVTYRWSASGGAIESGIDGPAVDVRWGGPGQGMLVLVADNGRCQSTDTMLVEVGDSVKPIVAPVLLRLCAGEEGTLRAEDGYATYTWLTPDGDIPGQELSVRRAGVYRVRVSTGTGCEGTSDPVPVEILPPPQPIISGPEGLCPGDTILLEATEGYVSYRWSDGSMGRTVPVYGQTSLTVTVVDSNGCTGSSPVHTVTQYASPAIPRISRTGMMLLSTPAARYQWYRNDSLLDGETGESCRITTEGTYRVVVWNATGCPASSEGSPIVCVQGRAVVSLPHLTVRPGDTVRVVPVLDDRSCLEEVGAHAFVAAMRYEQSVMVPISGTDPGVIDGTDRIIELRGSMLDLVSRAMELRFIATLGLQDSVPLMLDAFDWIDAPVMTERRHGSLRIEICREGGDRLFDGAGQVRLLPNSPNPFNVTTTIGYELIEKAHTELFVLDMLGKRICTLFAGAGEPGVYRVRFDAGDLASGQYIVVLRTPTVQRFRLISLLK